MTVPLTLAALSLKEFDRMTVRNVVVAWDLNAMVDRKDRGLRKEGSTSHGKRMKKEKQERKKRKRKEREEKK